MQQLKQQLDPKLQADFLRDFQQLQRRQARLRSNMLCSMLLLAMSLLLLFYHQQLCYAIFQFSPQLQHLHLPLSADALAEELGSSPDYFRQFITWLLWLGIKLCGALLIASVLFGYLKKINFMRKRIRGFVRHCLLWLVLFVLSWWGLATMQQQLVHQDRIQERYQQAMAYQTDIQQSELYQQIAQLQLAAPIRAYLLAQSALLHRPSDRAVASVYVQQLLQIEQQQPAQFQSYGFQPEQLFAMQYQLYGKAISPSAQSVAAKLQQINLWSGYSYRLFGILALLFVCSLICFAVLNWRFTVRIARIRQKLQA